MTAPAHIVVLGGGIGGLSAARHLAATGDVRVTLVEREPRHDVHSSGRSAEILRVAIDDPVTRALALETAERLGPEIVDPVGLHLATNEGQPAWLDDVERAGRVARAVPQGTAVDHVSLEGLHRFYFPLAGRIRATALVASLAREAQSLGVRFVRSAGNAALSCAGGAIDGVAFDGRSALRCDAVIVAAGAWSSALGGTVGAPLPLRCTTRHMFRVRGSAPPHPNTPIVWDDAAGFYLRPDGDSWVFSICDLTGGTAGAGPPPYPVDPSVQAHAMERLGEFAPICREGARVVDAWTGFRDLSPDDRPVLGPDERVPGLFWGAGLGGHGLTISLAVGRHAAEAALGRPTELARKCAASRFGER